MHREFFTNITSRLLLKISMDVCPQLFFMKYTKYTFTSLGHK